MSSKILMLHFGRTGKGTYWRALGFGQELVARNFEVTLLAISPTKRWGFTTQNVNGVELVETPDWLPGSLRSGWDPVDSLARVGWLRRRHFDLVHAFECRPVSLLPALYQQRRPTPLIIDWCDWFGRGGSVEERPNPLVRTLLRPVETFFEEKFRTRADGTTVINSVLKQKAVHLGVPDDTILYLPNGANSTDIQPQSQPEARQKLGLPADGGPYLIYTGAIFAADAALMAATFDRIHQQLPSARLLLAGYTNIAVEEMVQTPTAVIRSGPISFAQLATYLAAADIGWLPLANTGANQGRFPMKLHDYMAAAQPVVVTDVGDVGTLVQKEALGYVAAAAAEPLAAAVLKLWAESAATRTEMGLRGRQLAETTLSWPTVTDSLIAFYQRFL